MSTHSSVHRRGKTRRSKVSPGGDEADLIGDDLEMASVDTTKNNLKSQRQSMKTRIKGLFKNKAPSTDPINFITNLKQNARRWKDYATTRRKVKVKSGEESSMDRRRAGGQGLTPELGGDTRPSDAVDGTHLSESQREMRSIHNRSLIEYFARLGQENTDDTCVNLEYIESLLWNQANINCTDKHGQSVLHEAARAWDVDVARFLLDECRANIDIADEKGRTPLHVAAAVDYPEMVNYLIKAGANKEARTLGEEQTPVHFAARNDACGSLKALIKNGCLYKDVRDYKGRTPLHVAAELDRSETARLLLEVDDPAPAGVKDNSGQAAIVWMITKMPPVAKMALDQFHTTDRANRKQFFHLNWLEPRGPEDDRPVFPQTAIQVAVAYQRLDLIVHPVFERLNRIKWNHFGRLRAILSTVVNLTFILMWTIQGTMLDYSVRHRYDLPDQWWRILLFILALLLSVFQIKEELSEFLNSKKIYSQWREWRKKELERDLEFTHPRWPEEAQYLQQEMEELDKTGPQYFNDFWNIFDWICYALLVVCIITHLVDVFHHTNLIARLHIRIMAVTIILIWLRLMKNARAFSLLGPFIVIVGHMVSDVIKFAFLYLEFYVPFACAFSMIFAGPKVPEKYQGLPGLDNVTITVGGMGDTGSLLFTLFRLTLVDDYDYDGMHAVDATMTYLLLFSWFALSAILMLNLFIALMSDTFQRVYDNAKANAVMQKAITIMSIEEGLSKKRRRKFREFIHTQCAPEKDFYDDDTTDVGGEDLKKVTFQIKDILQELQEQWDMLFKPHSRKPRKQQDDLDDLKEQMYDYVLHAKRRNDQDAPDFSNISDNNDDDDNTTSRKKKRTPVSVARFEQEMDQLQDGLADMMERQNQLAEKVKRDMKQIKTLLQQVAVSTIAGQANRLDPRVSPTSPAADMTSAGRQNDVTGPTVEIQGTSSSSGHAAELSSSLVVAHRPPPSRVGSHLDMMTPRSFMDFSEPTAYGSSVHLPRQQSVISIPPASRTISPPHRGEDDWDNIERKRLEDMQNLRQKLSKQQQLVSQHNLQVRSTSVTSDDDAPREASVASQRLEDQESNHTDTTVIQPREAENNMDGVMPNSGENC